MKRRRVPSLVSSVVLGALVAGFGPFASPASAAVPGLVRISNTSPISSSSPKSVVATCPQGKKLIGTGAEINGGTGELVINDLIPNGGENTAPTAVAASGYEKVPFAGKWSITAYAICANPLPGLVQRGFVSDAQVVRTHGFNNRGCPPPKLLVGAGFEFDGTAAGKITLISLAPLLGSGGRLPNAVHLSAQAAPGAGTWALAGYAICANPLPGLVVIRGAIHATATNRVDGILACPAPKKLLGIGADLSHPFLGSAAITGLVPNGGVFMAPTAVRVTAFRAEGTSLFGVGAHAICADP